MIFKKIIIFFIFVIFITSCAEYKSPNKKEKIYYSSSGFALIYKDSLYLDKDPKNSLYIIILLVIKLKLFTIH